MTLRRRTELQRRVPLVNRTSMRRTELARGACQLRRVPMKRGHVEPKLNRVQRDALAERSGGICEIQTVDCRYRALDPCHRIGEGAGGRHGAAAGLNDRLSNVLHGCRWCHDWCHRNRTLAEVEGWMLRNGDDPLAERVNYRRLGWRWLDDEGGVHRAPLREVG